MAKKIYAHAKLVKGANRWYIDYASIDVATSGTIRHRKDFDLNDIEDLNIRQTVADILLRNLHTFAGESAKPEAPAPANPGETVEAAVKMALAEKMKSPRKNTHKGYKSISKSFLAWADRLHYAQMPVRDFARKHAKAYFAWLCGSRPYRACTLNNYLMHLGGMWTEIQKDELTDVNPWHKITPIRKQEKLRRAFTAEERKVVATEIERTDYWLFRGVLLQFFCYVRPVELCRLKFKDFNLAKGTVTVTEYEAKKWKRCVKTIPKEVLTYFVDGRFDQYPANWLMYSRVPTGHGWDTVEPGTVAVRDDVMYKRHKKLLHRLKDGGQLRDITGLTWYSWKDTGISLHAHKTTPLATRDQAGHSDFDMTLTYYHQEEVNAEYRALENDLF